MYVCICMHDCVAGGLTKPLRIQLHYVQWSLLKLYIFIKQNLISTLVDIHTSLSP